MREGEEPLSAPRTIVVVVINNVEPVDVDQQSHDWNFGTWIPMDTHDTVEMSMVLHVFNKLKPVPIPMHTIGTLSQVYPYPCDALLTAS
jgi:hypothetical protein